MDATEHARDGRFEQVHMTSLFLDSATATKVSLGWD